MFKLQSTRAHKRRASYALITSSVLALLAFALFPEILPMRSHADEPITPTPNITIGNNGVISLEIEPGNFGSASEDIVVTTSNYTGYRMTIAPVSGNTTELVNTSNPNDVLPSIENELTEVEFINLSTTAYGLSIDDGNNYQPVENGSIINSSDGTTNETTGAFTLTLGAKAIADTPAGVYARTFNLTAAANPAAWNVTYEKNLNGATDTIVNSTFPSADEGALSSGNILTLSSKTPTRPGYKFLGWNELADGSGTTTYPASGTITLDPEITNKIVLYAQWGCGDGYICYDDNGADAVNGGKGTMEQTTLQSSAYATGSSQTLVAPNYSKAGYGFAGWNTKPDGTGTNYGPNETITMPATGLQLYARWVASSGTLQGWSGCSGLQTNDAVALTDNRDNQVYTVAKLADGKCWMIENLRLDITDSDIIYNNDNTNHPASSFLAQKNAFNSNNPTWQTCEDNSIACDDQLSYSLANIERSNTASHKATNQTSSWYAYGGMYNWFTATAGNGLYSMDSGSGAGDICPNGWHLPTGGTSTTTDFKSLNNAVNSGSTSTSAGLRAYPTNYVYSGRYDGTLSNQRGVGGEYWSSTVRTRDYAYSLKYNSSSSQPGTFNTSNKYQGNAVRCLAGNPNYYIIYDANNGTGYGDPQMLSSIPDGNTEYTLIASNFKRDGYGFAGWSKTQLDPDSANFASALAAAVANNQVYGPNAQIKPSASDFTDKELKLYAIWVAPESGITMQSFNPTDSAYDDTNKPEGSVIALTDSRDNEVYAVAKLKDGNWWMIENMRLDPSSSTTTITTSNTNHPTTAFVTDINDNYKGKTNDPNTTLWKTCRDITPVCYNQVSFAINNLKRENVTPIVTHPTYNNQTYGWRSYGAYYNWYTATAGQGIYNKTSGTTDGDLCPFGWHLPQGSNKSNDRGGNTPGGFYYLNYKLNDDTLVTNATASINLRKYPNNFVFSKQYDASGTSAFYWSSTAYGVQHAYNPSIGVNSINPSGNGNEKYNGYAVRCLVGTTTEEFILKYSVNGGTGSIAQQSGNSSTRRFDFTLSATEPSRSGFTFAGWSTDQNATEQSTLYQAGDTFTAYQPGTTTLYAVWVPEVIVHFDPSGGMGTMTDQGIPSGTSRSLRPNTFLPPSGYDGLAGWTTIQGSTNVEYSPEASFTAPTVTPPGPLEITLYAVWGRSRKIVYNINTNDANANGAMSNQAGLYEYQIATLWASNFARSGYGFAGWSTVPLDSASTTFASDLATATTNGQIYGPNETIVVPTYEGLESDYNLYAVWVPTESGISMQTFDPDNSTYSSKPIGSVIALNDSRDNQVYAIAKLKDGNWWMIENLRLNPADTNTIITVTNTNNPSSTFVNTDISLANIQNASGKKAYNNPYFRTCIDTDGTNGPTCQNQISFGLGNLIGGGGADDKDKGYQNRRWYSYGVMYNWYTATAGHGTYSTAMGSGSVPGDICPAGWHIPYGGDETGAKGGNTSGGFYYLNFKLNNDSDTRDATASNNLRAYPNNFIYSGGYEGSNASSRGSNGYYWSSLGRTLYGNAHNLYINSSNIRPGTDFMMGHNGYAVRCVVDEPHTLTVSLNTGITSITVDGTTYYDGDTIPASRANTTHAIEAATFDPGYEFLSWSLDFGTVTSTSSQSTTYVMGNNDGILTATGKPITFDEAYDYAGKSKQGDHYLMQDMNPNICAMVASGQSGILTDVRDGTDYTVAKLGTQCWMSQNLRLNFASTAITSKSVSDLEAATNNPASGFFTAARGAASTVSPNFNGYEVVRYADNNLGGTSCPTGDCDIYGVYYNWYTATAGHGKQNDKTSGDTAGDLCPVNWHLPTGGTGNDTDVKQLNDAINSGSTTDDSGLLADPANFVYSGYFWGGDDGSGPKYGNDGRNVYGWYWTSTAMSVQKAYDFYVSNTASGQPGVYPGNDNSSKYLGASVRCLAKAGTGLSGPLFGSGTDEPTDTPTEAPTNEPEEPTNNETPAEQPAEATPTNNNVTTNNWSAPVQVATVNEPETEPEVEPEEEEDNAEKTEPAAEAPAATTDSADTTGKASTEEEPGMSNDDILAAIAVASLTGVAAASAVSVIKSKNGTGTNPDGGETPDSDQPVL